MEKISTPLNIIANYIVQNKYPVKEMPIIEENVQVPEENKETPQSKFVIHQVENLNSIEISILMKYLSKISYQMLINNLKRNTRKH